MEFSAGQSQRMQLSQDTILVRVAQFAIGIPGLVAKATGYLHGRGSGAEAR